MSNNSQAPWPELPYAAWRDTCETLQLWTQIVGKIRLARTPWLNHSWHVTLYVTAGLDHVAIPYGARSFQIDFDFIDHRLRISTSDGPQRQLALAGQSVASFYAAAMAALAELGIDVAIDETPNECPIRFDSPTTSCMPLRCGRRQRFWQVLVNRPRVQAISHWLPRQVQPGAFFLGQFRSCGDAFLRASRAAASRRRAKLPDAVAQEAYSHEVSSGGFWPGGGAIDYPAFYSYAYPEPPGFARRRCGPTRRSSAKPRRIHPALRCRAHGRRPTGAARFPAEHL